MRSDNCSYAGTGVISVSYTNGGSTSCSDTKTVSVQGAPTAKPTGIEVWGFDWSMNGTMGQTCPNTTLELHPIDTNPDYPTTAYQWSITGATILAGQNTGSLLIRTSSASRSNQVYAVRANKNHCGWSGWRHLSATSSSANCFGGGVGIGFLRPSNTGSGTLDFTDYFYQMPASEVVEVEVISLTGRQLYVGRSTRHSPEIGIQQLPAGWVFLRLYDPIGDNYATVRHQIVY
ncbi:MAG TPA: hypothetical protein DCP28_19125 [Cytophagales bacterium]|nr:hypothetical protein [Cytophagales bacterium]